MILEISNVLVSSDIITEQFCCDLDKCKGICCVEGDAGAPVTMDEIAGIESALDTVWGDMSASAQAVVDHQGVAYTDRDGDLVTSIVGGKDCVFTCYEGDCCLCALERAYRKGKTQFIKPISCALYPIREKRFKDGTVALNYNRWDVCADAVRRAASWDCAYTVSLKVRWCAVSVRNGTTNCVPLPTNTSRLISRRDAKMTIFVRYSKFNG